MFGISRSKTTSRSPASVSQKIRLETSPGPGHSHTCCCLVRHKLHSVYQANGTRQGDVLRRTKLPSPCDSDQGKIPCQLVGRKELQENEMEFQRKENGSFLSLSSGKELIFLPLRKIIYISRILIALSLSQLENSLF